MIEPQIRRSTVTFDVHFKKRGKTSIVNLLNLCCNYVESKAQQISGSFHFQNGNFFPEKWKMEF